MRRAHVVVPMLAGALVQVGLVAGAFDALPVGARLALALVVLVLLPGHGWLAALGAVPPGGRALASGWALGLGVFSLSAQVLLTRTLGVPFTVLVTWSALPALLAWIAAARFGRSPAEDREAAHAPLAPLALALVALAALMAAVHVGRLGTPLTYYTDSPDHIGTIRRMMASGDAFPTDAFFRDAGAHGADPRKGLWHPCVALIATLAGADPVDAWRLLGMLIAPLFVLNAAAFGRLVAGPAGAVVAAWVLFLTYGRSLGLPPLREAVFATKLADQLALATATAVLADLQVAARAPGDAARWRWTAVGLALGTVCAHVFGAIQFALVFGSLGLALLVRDRGFGPEARRLTGTVLSLGVACLPYLLWRARLSYAPSNPIHLDPQGLMLLPGGAAVISPGVLWDWMGPAWVLFPLSWWFWARRASRTPVLFLLAASVAVFGMLFVPPVVGVLLPKLGYLLMRFVWILPLHAAFAFALAELGRAVASSRGRARFAAAVGLVGTLALLRHPLEDAVLVTRWPKWVEQQEAAASVLPWARDLAWVDRHLPQGSVVLSDPATSYAVPMLTRHWVQTLLDQHSSPNDSLALERILDARDALDPRASWSRTRAVVRRWGVTHLILNGRFDEVPRLDYWAPTPEWFAAARARLDARPEAFPRLHDAGDFVVYGIAPEVLDSLASAPTEPVHSGPVVGEAEWRAAPDVGEGVRLVQFAPERHVASPGDTIRVRLAWCTSERRRAGQYDAFLRFERALPAGTRLPGVVAKPGRKLLERARGERYRFRHDHNPTGGALGVDLWEPGRVVPDSVDVVVPLDVAPGDWQIQLKLARQPHYPNYQLLDYFSDHDYYSGVALDSLRIVRRPSTN